MFLLTYIKEVIIIRIKNVDINYLKIGTGKNVLILPGWGTTIETYITLINSISKYRTVYCLDMPGFGKSSEPPIAWDLDDFVEFVLEFINKLEIQELDLIGHSNGGRIIIKLMNHPKLNIKINNIILIGSAGIVNPSLSTKCKVKLFKCCKTIFKLYPLNLIFPDFIENLKNKIGSDDYKNASPIMKKCLVNLISKDSRQYLPNIKVPTLLIWGTNDKATPISDGEIMEKLIPDSGLIKIENCSHYVFLEQPAYVNKIINNFLTRGDNK